MGSKQRRSFCKIMLPCFTRQLRIPSDFVKKNRVILSVKQVKLRTSNGEIWKVKPKKMDNGEYYFTKGWNKFAKKFGLKIMDFVVFKYAGDYVFDVTIYGITGLENEISDSESDDEDYDLMNPKGVQDMNTKKPKAEHVENESGSCSKGVQSPLYFEVRLKPYQKRKLNLKKGFAMVAGLIGKRTVKVEHVPSRHCQNVGIYQFETPQRLRVDLANGWSQFRKANLVFGKTYSFEFKPRKNVIQVKELRKKTSL